MAGRFRIREFKAAGRGRFAPEPRERMIINDLVGNDRNEVITETMLQMEMDVDLNASYSLDVIELFVRKHQVVYKVEVSPQTAFIIKLDRAVRKPEREALAAFEGINTQTELEYTLMKAYYNFAKDIFAKTYDSFSFLSEFGPASLYTQAFHVGFIPILPKYLPEERRWALFPFFDMETTPIPPCLSELVTNKDETITVAAKVTRDITRLFITAGKARQSYYPVPSYLTGDIFVEKPGTLKLGALGQEIDWRGVSDVRWTGCLEKKGPPNMGTEEALPVFLKELAANSWHLGYKEAFVNGVLRGLAQERIDAGYSEAHLEEIFDQHSGVLRVLDGGRED